MTLQDLLVTPMVLLVIYLGAYFVRPSVTDIYTRRYFIPALTVKIIGALGVGFIYQFYYDGGDTYHFFNEGTTHVYNAFNDSFFKGVKMLLANGEYDSEIVEYSNKIFWFRDSSSYFVIKCASIFSLLTKNTYSSIAVLFAAFSFAGLWALFNTFYYFFQVLHKQLALAVLFVPSVFFWGSGLLKDTLTIGALGFATWAMINIFFKNNWGIKYWLLLLASFYIIFNVKVYIMICFIPAAIIWIALDKRESISNFFLRQILGPFLVVMAIAGVYVSMNFIVDKDSKYSLDNLAQTAQITAYDIRYFSGKDAGSGYTLGDLDGTFASMVRLAPSAVNVALFRPYIWEVKSPIMLLSALESLFLLGLTLWVLFRSGLWPTLKLISSKPEILFCFTFSIIFAFAVGVSTYNFGSLVRYKIPMIPFFLMGLFFTWFYSNKAKKLVSLERTE